MEHCRRERKPYMIEAMVSRLYGHSSSSGALRVKNEPDCIDLFEQRLLEAGALDRELLSRTHEEATTEEEEALVQVSREPVPSPSDVEKPTYADSRVDGVYPGDYTGLP